MVLIGGPQRPLCALWPRACLSVLGLAPKRAKPRNVIRDLNFVVGRQTCSILQTGSYSEPRFGGMIIRAFWTETEIFEGNTIKKKKPEGTLTVKVSEQMPSRHFALRRQQLPSAPTPTPSPPRSWLGL